MTIDRVDKQRHTSTTVSNTKAGSGSGTFADALGKATGTKTAAQELEDYVNMTPAQRLRVDLLKKLGLTEDDLAAMPAAERQAVEAKLKDLVQQEMQKAQEAQRKGARVDTVA
jgi:hypothetical protein